MEITGLLAGPKIGLILHALLEEVLEDPARNSSEYLGKRAGELAKLPEPELKAIGEQGKEIKVKKEEKAVKEIRQRHWVS